MGEGNSEPRTLIGRSRRERPIALLVSFALARSRVFADCGSADRSVRATSLAGFFHEFALERMFGAVAGFGEVGVGSFHHGILIAVGELAFHGIVAGLRAVVGFVGTFSAVGVVTEMIAGVRGHKALSN